MALKTISFAVLCFLVSCTAEQNCSEAQCKLLPVGTDSVTTEFQRKASEKGVRMVYLNLKIGNDSYRPLDVKDEFLPERWVWARSISEPMLSFPYDYDILSLGLFNLQVRSMNIQVKDDPNGCLAGLNSSCQNMVVGRALLQNVTQDSSSDHLLKTNPQVVCVAIIQTYDDGATSYIDQIKYNCCRLNATNFLRCDLPVAERSDLDIPKWLDILALMISLILTYYWPAIPLALPDCVFNYQDECVKEERLTRDQQTNTDRTELTTSHASDGFEQIPGVNNQTAEEHTHSATEQNEQIPVDDASPISYSTLLRGCLQRLPDLRVSFNLKLLVMMFCILPSFVYLKTAIYFTLKEKYLRESLMKSPKGLFWTGLRLDLFPDVFILKLDIWTILIISSWVSISLLLVLILRPKDFLIKSDKPCLICYASVKFSELYGRPDSFSRGNLHQHVGYEMLLHMKLLQQWLFLWAFLFLRQRNSGLNILQNLFSCPLINGKVSRAGQVLYVLWVLILIAVGAAVFPVICLILYLLILFSLLIFGSPVYVIFRHLYLIILPFQRNATHFYSCLKAPFFVRMICMIAAMFCYFIIGLILILSCKFIVKTLGFTIMGLALNAEIVSPYAAFLLVVITNVYLCYANLQNRYKEIKEFIFNYWQQELHLTNSDQDTIPTKLFWFVIDKLFPIETEICLMVRNMALIVSFLCIALSSIILFGNMYNISAVNATIGVFVSGVIPVLLFRGSKKGKHFNGWEKVKIKREIETEVQEFVAEETRGSGINSESIQRRS